MPVEELPTQNNFKEDAVRLEHLSTLQKSGANPFPAHSERKQTLAEAKALPEGTAVTIAGRLVSRREMGKLCFTHFEDASGRLQVVLSENELNKENFKFFLKNFDLGDFVQITGTMFITHKGEISVLAKKYTILSKALLPLPEKWHGLTDMETRYRKRYLDLLSNEEAMRIAKVRSLLVRALRNYFDSHGFYEVETPVLQTLYGGALAKPFVTHHNALDIPLYLRIAPELYLKRLIVGGFEKVYEIAKCFRNEGIDHNHNPEFTQIEFYQAYADYTTLMNMVEEYLPRLITAAGLPFKFTTDGKEVDFTPPYPRVTMRELIKQYAKIDIEEYPDQKTMFAVAKKLKVDDADETSGRGKLIDDIYKKYARPNIINPIFMIDHPVELSPLAKRREDNPAYVERFQLLCVGGNELCNAFSELNDPIDQEARFKEQVKNKAAGDEESMPYDEDFIEALKHGMPPTAGLGMGIDRLVKLLVNASSLKEVILFPTLRPLTGNETGAEIKTLTENVNYAKLPMDRAGAWQLLKKYNQKPASFNHYLESEAVMRALAKHLGKDVEWWGMAGLLHDIDWDLTSNVPENHLTLAPNLLKEAGFSDDFIEVVISHGYGCNCAGLLDKKRSREIEYALAAGETVTGLVHASARLRPDKIKSLTVESLLKKFKDKSFAANVSRSTIKECEKLNLPLKDFLKLALDAIKAIADQVDLN